MALKLTGLNLSNIFQSECWCSHLKISVQFRILESVWRILKLLSLSLQIMPYVYQYWTDQCICLILSKMGRFISEKLNIYKSVIMVIKCNKGWSRSNCFYSKNWFLKTYWWHLLSKYCFFFCASQCKSDRSLNV